jgi:hypothetical protein
MEKEIIRSQIRELLETVTEQIEATDQYKEKIPRIEFDLLLENLRKLYECLYLLQKAGKHEGIREPQKPPRSASRKNPPSGPLDLFAGEPPTFNIKLQEVREKSFVQDHIQAVEKNLKSLITINEKFVLINELFDGNLREYNESIETLNGFKDLRPALDYLDLLRNKNLWETTSRAFVTLRELLERRFA